MAKCAEIIEYAFGSLNLEDADTKAKVWKAVRNASKIVAQYCPWTWLQKSISVTIADGSTTGFVLPADMIAITGPLRDSGGYLYFPVRDAQVANPPSSTDENDDSTYNAKRYYGLDANVEPLVEAKGISVEQGATAIAFSPALAATDRTGEYIEFEEAAGPYKLASNAALADKYWGKRVVNGYYTIRPRGVKRVSFFDGRGVRVAVSAMTVHYWAYPPPLYQAWQTIPDNWLRPMQIATWLESVAETVDRRAEGILELRRKALRDALSEAKMADGQPPVFNVPRDHRGYVRRLGWR